MKHDTGEYTYDVLIKCTWEIEEETMEVKCWIICDGDVVSDWI